MIEVRQNVLKQNDVIAHALRLRFHDAGVFVVSLVSSPGAGKTALLEKTLTLLRQRFRVAALVGDLATENDAVRLARSQAPVNRLSLGPFATSKPPWCRTRSKAGSSKSSTSCSSRTWAISFVLLLTISARIFGSCSCPLRKAKKSLSNIPRFLIAPT